MFILILKNKIVNALFVKMQHFIEALNKDRITLKKLKQNIINTQFSVLPPYIRIYFLTKNCCHRYEPKLLS